MQEETGKRVCKRCLLRELDYEEYQQKLERVLKLMDSAEKAADEVYEERLSHCKACEKLSQGTCLACGCYVELRAATKTSHCPDKKW